MNKNKNELNNIYKENPSGEKQSKKGGFHITMQGVVAIMLSVFIIFIGVTSVLLPDKKFSENENRYLSDFPDFTLKDLFSGDYIADVETYLQDHFPGRDFFVSGKADVEIALGKDQNNGVYLGEDGYLIQEFTASSKEDLDKKIARINALIQKLEGVEITVAIAPSSNLVNGDKLPNNRPDDDIQGTLDYINDKINGNIANLSGTLSEINKVQQLYFKTDHHWNTYGAYYAYCEIVKSMGDTPIPITEYEKVVLSEAFKGTMFSQGGYFNMKGEEFAILQNITKPELTVNYAMSGIVTDTLYADKHLSEKDKYAYFLDGNHPIITVENANAKNDKHIVVVKDSYANIMVPFLSDTYSKVTVIDLRFYQGSISDMATAEGVDDIVILYNIDGFQTDTGIFKLR